MKYCTTLLTNEDNFDFISGFFTCADACERILSQGGIESLRFESYSLMSHIHSSILFTYLTLSTLLILSAYRPLVKDSKDIKSSSKDIKNAIILLNF